MSEVQIPPATDAPARGRQVGCPRQWALLARGGHLGESKNLAYGCTRNRRRVASPSHGRCSGGRAALVLHLIVVLLWYQASAAPADALANPSFNSQPWAFCTPTRPVLLCNSASRPTSQQMTTPLLGNPPIPRTCSIACHDNHWGLSRTLSPCADACMVMALGGCVAAQCLAPSPSEHNPHSRHV